MTSEVWVIVTKIFLYPMSYKSSSKFSCYNFIVCFDSVAPVNFFTILGIQHVTMAQTVKSLPAIWENWVQSLDPEDPLEKEMATHSSILAWKIPWTEKHGGLQSTGSRRVRHDWVTPLSFSFFSFTNWEVWMECSFLNGKVIVPSHLFFPILLKMPRLSCKYYTLV